MGVGGGFLSGGFETVVLEKKITPRGEIQLQRRGDHFEIIFNGVFLMASYNGRSEKEMAYLAFQEAERPVKRVLVGGLGIGCTLRAVLDYPEVEQVDLVELEPSVLEWGRTYFAPLNGNALGDRRVRATVGDLVEMVELVEMADKVEAGPYGLVAVDIDNGPDWVVIDSNRAIYSLVYLRKLRRLLGVGGVLAFWSASRAPGLYARLNKIFGRVMEKEVTGQLSDTRCGANFVYLARK
ncbi:MAG: spermine/spermidine synthase [Firmicutes bacterium]|nr:spermine/spermidine synthase [Bacillota bacterium]